MITQSNYLIMSLMPAVVFMDENKDDIEPLQINIAFFIGLVLVMTWFGLFPSVVTVYWFFTIFPFSFNPVYLLLLIPLFILLYGIALVCSLVSTKVGIWIVHKRVAYPEQGTYRYAMDEPQTRAFILKGNIKNFARWSYNFFHFKFLQAFWLRRMGVKIGKNVKLSQQIEDDDFIEIDDNSFMAKESILSGHMLDHTHLTLLRTKVGKNCILDHDFMAVGSTIGDNSVFKPYTFPMKGIICKGSAIYEGVPVRKIGDYSDLSPTDIKELKAQIKKTDKKDIMKERIDPIKVSSLKLFLWKLLVVVGGSIFALIFPLLYSLLFNSLYSPTDHLFNIVLLIPIPFVFLIALGIFIFGTSFMITLIRWYYDSKVEIPEGVYDLEDPRAKYFKIKHCLQKFGLRLFHATPFKIGDTIGIRAFTNSFIGVNVKMEDAYIDPQYLKIGDYTQIATRTRVHTFKIADGKLHIKWVKLGANVLIAVYSHIAPGVVIEDGAMSGIGTWFEEDKTYSQALWIGNPARKLPFEAISRSDKVEDKYID